MMRQLIKCYIFHILLNLKTDEQHFPPLFRLSKPSFVENTSKYSIFAREPLAAITWQGKQKLVTALLAPSLLDSPASSLLKLKWAGSQQHLQSQLRARWEPTQLKGRAFWLQQVQTLSWPGSSYWLPTQLSSRKGAGQFQFSACWVSWGLNLLKLNCFARWALGWFSRSLLSWLAHVAQGTGRPALAQLGLLLLASMFNIHTPQLPAAHFQKKGACHIWLSKVSLIGLWPICKFHYFRHLLTQLKVWTVQVERTRKCYNSYTLYFKYCYPLKHLSIFHQANSYGQVSSRYESLALFNQLFLYTTWKTTG